MTATVTGGGSVPPFDRLLSAKEAADYLGISLKRLYEFCRDGSLRHLRLADTTAGVLRFRRMWLDAWAEAKATGGRTTGSGSGSGSAPKRKVIRRRRNRRYFVVAFLDVKRRRFDVVCAWRLDRLGRNLKHLVVLLEEWQGLGIAFVSLGEGIDCTTAAGKLQLHILAALAEFERERIKERVAAGLARVKAKGQRLGRPKKAVPESLLAPVRGLSVRQAARRLGISPATAHRWLSQKTCSELTLQTR